MVDRIKELASSKGLSLNGLEEACGLSTNTIYRWDKSSPSVDKVVKVAEYFGVSLQYMLGLEEPKQSEYDISEEALSVAKAFDKADTYTRLDVLNALGIGKKKNLPKWFRGIISYEDEE